MRDGWAEVRLGDVLVLDNAKLGEHDEEPVVFSLSKYDGVVLADDYFDKRIASDKLDGYKVLGPGGWAYSTIHIDEGSIATNHHGLTGVLSPMYTTMRWVGQDDDPRYFELLLRTPRMLTVYRDHAAGTVNRRRSLAYKAFAELRVDVPPLVVQRRVVDLVDAVDTYAAAASRGAAASSQIFFAVAASMDRLSDEFVELGEIADVVSGVTKDSKRQQDPSYVEVPYLRVANVQRAALDLADVVTIRVPPAKARTLRLEPRDVLFNEGGDRDKLGRGWVWEGQVDDCIHQNHVMRARITDERFDPYFVAGWANGPFGQRWFELNGTQTTNLASLNLSTLRRFPIPVVEAGTQVDIGGALLQLKAVVGASATAETAVRALRGRLLESLLSGEHEIPGSYDDLVGVT